jgi:hypothetical protein
LPDCWERCYACRPQGKVGVSRELAPQQVAMPPEGRFGLVEVVQAADDLGPFPSFGGLSQSLLQSIINRSARKLQNTWPRMVASHRWKIGRVSRMDLAVRMTLSTIQRFL